MTKEETLAKLSAALYAHELMTLTLHGSSLLELSRTACAASIYELIFIPNQGSMPKKPARKTVKKQVAKKKK